MTKFVIISGFIAIGLSILVFSSGIYSNDLTILTFTTAILLMGAVLVLLPIYFYSDNYSKQQKVQKQ